MTEQNEQFEPMSIETAVGSRVVFMGQNGYVFEREQANRILTIGTVYEVKYMDVGRSSSTVTLKGIPGCFNTVMFKNTTDDFDTYDWFGDSYPTMAQIQECVASIESATATATIPTTPPVDTQATFTIRTSCRGHQQQTTINQTEQESIDSFMNEFGEEPTEFITIYTSSAFNPKDIQGRTTSYHCHCDY